jgi:hypothetical protein
MPIRTGWGVSLQPQTQAAKWLIAIAIPITARAVMKAMQAFRSGLRARNWTLVDWAQAQSTDCSHCRGLFRLYLIYNIKYFGFRRTGFKV